MHSQSYKYTEDDLKYADDPETKEVWFHYNSDMSGEIVIENEISVIRVPGWMLMEFVGRHVNSEFVSTLEGMDGRDTLKFLSGDGI